MSNIQPVLKEIEFDIDQGTIKYKESEKGEVCMPKKPITKSGAALFSAMCAIFRSMVVESPTQSLGKETRIVAELTSPVEPCILL